MKISRLVAAIVVAALLLSGASLCSMAGDMYIDEITATNITLTDAGGNPITPITPNTDIYANIQVKKTGDRINEAKLFIAYYERNVLKSVKSQSVALTSVFQTVTAKITTGADVSHGKIQAFLWDGNQKISILTKKADFSSSECKVMGIYFDKVLIPGFNSGVYSYSKHLSLGEYDYPEIFVDTSNLAAKVEIDYGTAFPSDVKIKVTAPDNSNSLEYTLNFTKETGLVSDVKFRSDSSVYDIGSDFLKDTNDIFEPVFKTGAGALSPGQAGYYETPNLESYYSAFADTGVYSNNYFYAIPDVLKDSVYIQLERGKRGVRTDPGYLNNPNANPNSDNALTFNINTSADVFYAWPGNPSDSLVSTNTPWINNDNWEAIPDKISFVESNGTVGGPAAISNISIFKKTFYTNPGEIKQINIGGYKQSYFTPIVFIRFVSDDSNAFLKEIRADGELIPDFAPDKYTYEYTLIPPTQAPNEITVAQVVGGATVTVDKSVNNDKTTFTINVTARDTLTEREYIIEYSVLKPKVSNVKLNTDSGARDVPDDRIVKRGDMPDPVFKTGGGAISDPNAAGYYETPNLTSWYSAFGDSNYANNYFLSLPAILDDSYYIKMNRGWRGNRTSPGHLNNPNANPNALNAMTFDINASADIYYVFVSNNNSDANVTNYAPWLLSQGWEKLAEYVQYVDSTGNASGPAKPLQYWLFKKTYTTELWQTASVSIGGFLQNYFCPIIFVKFHDITGGGV